jgi:rubrerythrin
LKLKNKINEQEKGHQKMFDSINEKLNDETFLQQAMNSGTKDDEKTQPTQGTTAPTDATAVNTTASEPMSKLSSKAPDGMTEADEKCYEARYGDLNGVSGRRHFQDVGSW